MLEGVASTSGAVVQSLGSVAHGTKEACINASVVEKRAADEAGPRVGAGRLLRLSESGGDQKAKPRWMAAVTAVCPRPKMSRW